jgi:steroid delta-isomerase-like uncharacterized protein
MEGPKEDDIMSSVENKEIARKLYESFNKHDLDSLMSLCTDDVKYTDMVTGQTFEGPAGFREASGRWMSAFPDAQVEIVNEAVTDDFVFTEFTGRGTHTGAFAAPGGMSIPATGKRGELPCCEALRLRDGKIVSGRIYYDMLTLLRQLGIAPGVTTERPAEAPAPEAPMP